MAAGSTYTPIATTTLGSAAASYTFSSIPSTYTDLVCVIAAAGSIGTDIAINYNGDTGTNYSETILYGTGSAAGSVRETNTTRPLLDYYGGLSTTLGNQVTIVNIMNYSNTTTYKTALSRSNQAGSGVDAGVVLWRNTAAITSVTIKTTAGGANLAIGSVLTLYGIQAA